MFNFCCYWLIPFVELVSLIKSTAGRVSPPLFLFDISITLTQPWHAWLQPRQLDQPTLTLLNYSAKLDQIRTIDSATKTA
jgi:hypothetical protein